MILFLLCFIQSVFAWQVDSQGEVTLENFAFKNPSHRKELKNFEHSLHSRLGAALTQRGLKLSAEGVGRVALSEKHRDLLYLREAYGQYDFGYAQFWAGSRILNWSPMEVFSSSDILNSRVYDFYNTEYDQMGEATVGGAFQWGLTSLEVHYLPRLQRLKVDPIAPRFGLSSVEQVFLDGQGDKVDPQSWQKQQWALRLQTSFGGGDGSLYWIHHYDRMQPRLALSFISLAPNLILTQVDQFGATWVQPVSDFTVKVEWAYRKPKTKNLFVQEYGLLDFLDYQIATLAFEYEHQWTSGGSTTLLLEGQFVPDLGAHLRKRAHSFQRDLALTLKHNFSGAQGQTLELSALADVEFHKQMVVQGAYSQRVGDQGWKFKVGGRYIDAPPRAVAGENFQVPFLHGQHYGYMEVSRSF